MLHSKSSLKKTKQTKQCGGSHRLCLKKQKKLVKMTKGGRFSRIKANRTNEKKINKKEKEK